MSTSKNKLSDQTLVRCAMIARSLHRALPSIAAVLLRRGTGARGRSILPAAGVWGRIHCGRYPGLPAGKSAGFHHGGCGVWHRRHPDCRLATYALRNVRWKGLAIPASFPPVIANALIVGAFEITVFFSDSAPTATMAVFNAVAVGVGEIISCCVLGVALVKLIESNESLNKIFVEQ